MGDFHRKEETHISIDKKEEGGMRPQRLKLEKGKIRKMRPEALFKKKEK